MSTPHLSKKNKRNFGNVEQSPDVDQKLNDLRNELKELVMQTFDSFVDKVESRMNQVTMSCFMQAKDLIMSEVRMQAQAEISKSIIESEKKIEKLKDDLNARLNSIEQEKLNNSIEISGLNQAIMSSEKSAFDIASQTLGIYNVNNFKSAHKRQIKIKSETKNLLVVTFHTYEDKMHALERKRSTDRNKSCTVYFNHSLTPYSRSLYMQARKITKSSNNLRTIISHGRIIIRKVNEKHGGTHIKSELDLTEIESSSPQSQST